MRKKQYKRADTARIFYNVYYYEHFKSQKELADFCLEMFQTPFSISPLHDKDVYSKDEIDEKTKEIKHKAGENKKEHFHVLLKFKAPRSVDRIREISKNFGLVQVAGDEAICARYHIHADNPEKAQYLYDDVYNFKYPYSTVFHSLDDESEILDDIAQIVIINNLRNITDLISFCYFHKEFRYINKFISSHSFFVSKFLDSLSITQKKYDFFNKPFDLKNSQYVIDEKSLSHSEFFEACKKNIFY